MATDQITLSEPACGARESELVHAVLQCSPWSDGPMLDSFEAAFAGWSDRAHAVAVASGTLGTWIVLRALGIGPGDEVICASHTWHQVAHAITLADAAPVFADIDYWSGCLDVAKVQRKIGKRTRAILAGNTNGHPAAWGPLRELADANNLTLIEDSTEALGSRYGGRGVGSFGKATVFDFSAPSALCAGEGGMIVTDDESLAYELRCLRRRLTADRKSVSLGARVPLQTGMSELTAALGLAQLAGLDERLTQRKRVEAWYHEAMETLEGIKPPYQAEDAEEVHWMLFVVHLGKRFTHRARAQMIDDMQACGIETAAYSHPLHEQFHYMKAADVLGGRRGSLPETERIGDRALALPLHTQLSARDVRYIVKTLKDTATNVGAGAAIYR
ncbi:dTDP-4-amino-4,6-dideoxygalactose transaminase [Paraburkholderia sp. RAU2J]|uniref:DegT/DnrJ/EryC1/StrS family aminotransferase n=1 Tax=Paraburkholderia sp. RAU2J TaxID=1938810 RepID=UPI000EACD0BA|nr:DegT/DnrJ/EryC1/StrS family aminotransferase [Paraburkholderia sp. RAU2J]RKT10386.1 dTDP-4-amino-4,6-dideoxygalactose transaminase [Paraburkholderia sp. RAU2J]